MASSPPTSAQCAHIRELSELKSISDEDLPTVFLTSLSTIFSYSIEDVTKSIEDFSKDSIGKLYRLLCDKAANTFTQYKGRKPVNRQVKHTMLPDIGILGYSLANESPLKELERIFHSPSESGEVISHQTAGESAQQTALTDILATVASLSSSLTKLEG